MNELIIKGKKAKDASYELMNISTELKNNALKKIAENLVKHSNEIIEKNKIDIENYRNNNGRQAHA